MAVTPGVREIREAVGHAYLANRPSFKRVKNRAEKRGLEVSREQYDELMRSVRTVDELIAEAHVDREKFKIDQVIVNSWGQAGSNYQVKARLKVKDDPATEAVVKPAPKVKVRESVVVFGETDMETLILPDIHFGYRLTGDYTQNTLGLDPIHSTECVEVYLLAAREFQPKTVVLLGDLLDLPAISKYLSANDLKHLIQPAIDAAGAFLQRLRAAIPKARIVMLKGNHDDRIDNHIKSNAPELQGLSRANDVRPVHGLDYLLHLQELGIELVGPYGAGIFIDGVWYTHGDFVGKRSGDTVSKMLANYHHSAVCGHVHRLELGYETRWLPDGPHEVFALSAGTGARIDGVVPGSNRSNWQQGFASISRGKVPQLHPIRSGVCALNGRVLRVGVDETTS